MKSCKIFVLALSLISLIIICSHTAVAHSGGTDGAGGHYNRSTGEYHYHHGMSAHQHPNGECPYAIESSKPKNIDHGLAETIIVVCVFTLFIIIVLYIKHRMTT